MTQPDELTGLLIDSVIDHCDRDTAATLATTMTFACQGKSYNNILMALALVLSDMVEDVTDELRRNAIVMTVAFLALRSSTPPGKPN